MNAFASRIAWLSGRGSRVAGVAGVVGVAGVAYARQASRGTRLPTPATRDPTLSLLGIVLLALTCYAEPGHGQSSVAFPKETYASRRARLVADLDSTSAIVIAGRYNVGAHELPKQDPDFWYLTGVESPFAVLVILPGARGATPRTALFLPDSFEFAGAQYPYVDARLRRAPWNRPIHRLASGRDANRATGVDASYAIDSLATLLPRVLGARTHILMPMPESLWAPTGMRAPRTIEGQFGAELRALLGNRTFDDVSPRIHRMRLVKDSLEIAALREAARISALSLNTLARRLHAGMNDIEAAGILEGEWKRLGASRGSFAPIIGSGEHAMTFFTVMGERYDAVNRVMRDGDLLFVDYGAAEARTYTSDLCRTYPIGGRFTAEQRKYYDIVLEAQEAGIAAIHPGGTMLDAIKAAANVFRKHGLEKYEDVATMGADRVWGMMPSPTHYLTRNAGIVRYTPYGAGVRDLGHHIGLEVQDSRDWSRPLEPGMVVTVEPKIYIPEKKIAIMIEDMILVTANGRENLSRVAVKKAEEVEQLMRR